MSSRNRSSSQEKSIEKRRRQVTEWILSNLFCASHKPVDEDGNASVRRQPTLSPSPKPVRTQKISTHFLTQPEAVTSSSVRLSDIHQTGLGTVQINKESTLPVIGAAKRRSRQEVGSNIKNISEKHLRSSLNPQYHMGHFERINWKLPSKRAIPGLPVISSQMIQLAEVHTVPVRQKHQSLEDPVPDRVNKTPTVTLFTQKTVDSELSPRKHSASKLGPEASITLPHNGEIQTDEHSESSQKRKHNDATGIKSSSLKEKSTKQQQQQSSKEKIDDVILGLCGLENIGNTCFMNSAIQCMSHVSDLTNHILAQQGLDKEINVHNTLGSGGKVARAYSELILKMWSGKHTTAQPKVLKNQIGLIASRFYGYNQQDSHEFINILLDTLHEDLKREIDDTTSIISDLFHGELQSTVVCLNLNCNEPLKTYDSMSFLALPLPSNGRKTITLEDCIHSLTEEEVLGENGQWFCSFCNQLVDANKKIDLWKLPKILIIQLKRFNYDLQSNDKIDTYVKYPLYNLDLSQFIANPEYDNKDYKYDLIAVSNHFGSLIGGHYTAYA
ncbi:unnamed protein product, partial [Didymodactylos carnosus]